MPIAPGTHFNSLYQADIEISDYIGSGGQGFVYKILYNGAPKALKIYKPSILKDPRAFYCNVKHNIENRSPSSTFLWPVDLLRWNGKTFGYVMDLRPEGYEELSSFIAGVVSFSSFRAVCNAALQIIAAFRILHNHGFSYQDLNDGNFFINPQNGNVLICDNDNVAPNGVSTGILGKPRYMAPEVVRGETMPNTQTDRFSLSVILFIMLTMTHPLEGKRFLVDCLTPEVENRIYGTEPIFLLDPDDRRNAPISGIHKNIGVIWPELPDYLKNAFLREFSRDVMMNPHKRTTEAEWQQMFIRFQSEILHCGSCGNDNFTYDVQAPVCSCCGKALPVSHRLKISGCDYTVPAVPGNILYLSQLETSDVETAGLPILLCRPHPHDPETMILVNISGGALTCVTPSGKRKAIDHKGAIPVNTGIKICTAGGCAEIL